MGTQKFVLLLLAAVPLVAEPVCRTVALTEGCYLVNANPAHPTVKLSVRTLELDTDYMPIVGFNVQGWIMVTDGKANALSPFNLYISRDDWDGFNSAIVGVPDGFTPTGVSLFVVSPVRRDSSVQIVSPV